MMPAPVRLLAGALALVTSLWSMPLLAPAWAADAAAGAKVTTAASADGATIYVVVNDVPITGYAIDQRIKLLSLMGGGGGWQARLKAMLSAPDIQERFKAFAIKHNPRSKEDVIKLQKQFVEGLRAQAMSESRPGLRDTALAQLINESLMAGEAKRLGMLAGDDDVDQGMTDMAKKNNKSMKEFESLIGASGVSVRAFRDRVRTQMSWQRVISSRFRGQVATASSVIDQELTAGAAGGGADAGVELKLQRIVIPQQGSDAASSVAGYAAADALRQKVSGCGNLSQLAKQIKGARFEDLGSVRPESLSADVRPMLASADAGTVPPPVMTEQGIAIYAVCERNSAAKGETARANARDKIEHDKLSALSKGLLSDLCAAASIEPRNGTQLKKTCGSD